MALYVQDYYAVYVAEWILFLSNFLKINLIYCKRSSMVSTLDCCCPVPGSILTRWLLIPVLDSILTQSPLPPRTAQEQELPLSEVGPSPGWQPVWILYHKICIKIWKKIYRKKKSFQVFQYLHHLSLTMSLFVVPLATLRTVGPVGVWVTRLSLQQPSCV